MHVPALQCALGTPWLSSALCRHAAGRVVDCQAKVMLTASGVLRGAKHIDLKAIVDDALGQCTKEVRAAAAVL